MNMLKKLGIVGASAALALTLTACGEESTEKEVKETPVENGAKEETKAPEKAKEEKPKEEAKQVVLVDDKNVKITFTGLKQSEDEYIGKEAKLKLSVVNKTDKDITVQADKVSVDGVMFDDVIYSSDITPNSTSTGSIEFMQLDEDTEFPEFKDNVKGELVVSDTESYETLATHKFDLSFKK